MNDFARGGGLSAGLRMRVVASWLCGKARRGYCPLCETKTFFVPDGTENEHGPRCVSCGSDSRSRALLAVLQEAFPRWRDLSVHESSPRGPLSAKLFRECPRYLPSHYDAAIQRGEVVNGIRCEDLGAQTFPPNRFDLVLTSEAFQHIASPRDGFTEIARTLKPGGAHVFSVKCNPDRPTLVRAEWEDGKPMHLAAPVYRAHPYGGQPDLLVTEWGHDLAQLIHSWSGLWTTVYRVRDGDRGILGSGCDVLISRKAPPPSG